MGTCTHHGCSGGKPDTYRTWPNLLTAVRAVAALVLVARSVDTGSTALLYAALATHWVGDMADGILARLSGLHPGDGNGCASPAPDATHRAVAHA